MTQDGFIHWDVQVINEAPNNMRWSKDSEFIVVSTPGVYKISVASFTTHPVKIEIFLNKLPGNYIHTCIRNKREE
jgi:phenolic acid decarboxylase